MKIKIMTGLMLSDGRSANFGDVLDVSSGEAGDLMRAGYAEATSERASKASTPKRAAARKKKAPAKPRAPRKPRAAKGRTMTSPAAAAAETADKKDGESR